MKRKIAAGALCGLAMWMSPLRADEPPRLDGHWEGVIVLRPGEFEVDMKLDLARAADGSLTGHLSYPNQGPKEYGLDTVQLDGDHVLITSTDQQGTVSVFQGRLRDGKTLAGDLTESGQKAPFELHRAEAAARKPPTLQSLASDGAELREQLNRDQGQVRVLLILSPTCAACRMAARLVERHLLEPIHDPGLSVYIVWEKIGPQDSPETAAQSAALLSDGRIHHFWSPDHFASAAFQAPVGIQRTTAWDVVLVFGKGKRWTDAPPAFDSFMHNQKLHAELPKDRLLNAETLAGEVKTLLGAPAPAASP